MEFNKDELEVFKKVLKELLEKADTYQKIVLERMIAKCKALINVIETGGMGE